MYTVECSDPRPRLRNLSPTDQQPIGTHPHRAARGLFHGGAAGGGVGAVRGSSPCRRSAGRLRARSGHRHREGRLDHQLTGHRWFGSSPCAAPPAGAPRFSQHDHAVDQLGALDEEREPVSLSPALSRCPLFAAHLRHTSERKAIKPTGRPRETRAQVHDLCRAKIPSFTCIRRSSEFLAADTSSAST